MKKFLMVIAVLVLTFVLTGCNTEITYTVNKDGSMECSIVEYYTPDEIDDITSMLGESIPHSVEGYMIMFGEDYMGTVDIDGVEHIAVSGGSGMVEPEEIAETEGYTVSRYEFVYDPGKITTDSAGAINEKLGEEAGALLGEDDIAMIEEIAGQMKNTIIVNMPDEIVLTNGKLSADKETVSFETNSETLDKLYAYTADSDKIIDFSGLEGNYTKKSKIKVVTPDKVKSIYVNGKKQTSKTIKLPKDGTYEIKVTTKYSSKELTVVRDTVEPKVTGVKNKAEYSKAVTVKFSDKGSGIASAKLNGKTVKSGKKITKAGSYTLTVTDNAGNKTTVKFTVK